MTQRNSLPARPRSHSPRHATLSRLSVRPSYTALYIVLYVNSLIHRMRSWTEKTNTFLIERTEQGIADGKMAGKSDASGRGSRPRLELLT